VGGMYVELWSVHVPPGEVMVAPPAITRNASRTQKAKAAPGTIGLVKEQRGQGHYKGRDPVEPRPGQSGCCSPRCLILCAVVALMCLRARGGRSSTTRWSSASVSRTSTHSSAYCASLASPISSICWSLSSIALLWLGAGTPRRIAPARSAKTATAEMLISSGIMCHNGGRSRERA
jgi:hypothetical protein